MHGSDSRGMPSPPDPPDPDEIARLLARVGEGNEQAMARLFPLVYDELREIAASLLARSNAPQTLQPTGLVHEAYIKLANSGAVDWRGKAQFASLAATAMRQILVDHLRGTKRLKRSPDRHRVTLASVFDAAVTSAIDILDLDDALQRLVAEYPRPARAVELRFFANMSRAEIAEVLGVSTRTVNTDLKLAQAWLLREMDRDRDE